LCEILWNTTANVYNTYIFNSFSYSVKLAKSFPFIKRDILARALSLSKTLKEENLNAFYGGLILFSLATSILFTPLPVFFSRELAIPQTLIFALYGLNSTGGVFGYFLAGQRSDRSVEKSALSRIVIFRSMLAFLLIATIQVPTFNIILATVILFSMGFHLRVVSHLHACLVYGDHASKKGGLIQCVNRLRRGMRVFYWSVSS
jgi:predicted MFS family arabinose efflux permease